MLKSFHNHPHIDIIIPGNGEKTIEFSVNHLLQTAYSAVAKKNSFSIALSGGSTPKALFSYLAKNHAGDEVFKKTLVFWSDERNALPTDQESNYHMAMSSGIEKLSIPKHHIFRMKGENPLHDHAIEYEKLIHERVSGASFDLIMLGMGEDGHTASLFPATLALNEKKRLVIPNYVDQKKCWRMTFTYPLIHEASYVVFYIIGKSKASIVNQVYHDHEGQFPASRAYGKNSRALWILDDEAASELQSS